VEANDNLDYVNAILDSDEGARCVGEFAIATNYKIDVCTTDILIDEKIGGTIHIALGRPYDGVYYSSIHWDIIKDTRKYGEIYVDGRLVFQNGMFLV
jgi:aminopeptidase